MAVTQYIGSRYVPIFADPIEWSSAKEYEPLTIVTHEGNSYTAKQFVPVGIDIANGEYWALTGNYNSQVEQYRRETQRAVEQINDWYDRAVTEYADKYGAKPFSFDTVAAMQNARDLLYVGAICHTNGFHATGDGGAAWYVISDTGNANGMDVIACGATLRANLVITGTFVTPEMYGAYGNGVSDDTNSIIASITSGKNVIGNNSYLISETITINSERTAPKKYSFCCLIYTGSDYALKITGYNGNLVVQKLTATNGSGVVIGGDVATWAWDIFISEIFAERGFGYKLIGVPSYGVSQIQLNGNLCFYGTNGLILDTENYWVGQNVINNIRFITDTNGDYAVTCDCSNYSVTGLTMNNVSFEGSHGGVEILNTAGAKSLETLQIFGARISELTNLGYKFIKISGSGVVKGVIFADMILNFDTSYDLSEYTPNVFLSELEIYGRLIGRGLNFNRAILHYNQFVPTLLNNIEIMRNSTEYNDTNLPHHIMYTTTEDLTYTLDVDKPFDGELIFQNSSNGNVTAIINGRSYTLSNNQAISVKKTMFNRIVQVISDMRIY